jgi:carbon monoxide dehydrogenase subunit G
MKFSHTMTYDAPPADVQAMLADPVFREKVCAAMNAVRHDVSIDGSGKGMKVVVDQTQPAQGIPSFAKKFVGDEIRIVQRESWKDESKASLTVEIPGKPGDFKGDIDLDDDGDGTKETVAGEIKVKIPMVGGKLEGLIGDLLRSALKSEERVGRAWLAGDR